MNSRVMNDLKDREKLEGRRGHCEYKHICGGCRVSKLYINSILGFEVLFKDHNYGRIKRRID